MTRPVGGLLLAAGGGSRLGRPKALVELHGRLLIEHGVHLMDEAGLRPRVVVLGAAADEVERRSDLSDVEVVVNHDWKNGMGGSLQCGLDALEGRAEAVVVTLVDQPFVGAEAVTRLIGAWHTGASAAVATYNGQPRNPVLIDTALWGDVRQLAVGDRGARMFLRAHPELVALIDCDGTGSPDDIDTVEDLQRLASPQLRRST